MNANDFRLGTVADLEALNFQTSKNFDRSTKLDLTTESPISGSCCYGLV